MLCKGCKSIFTQPAVLIQQGRVSYSWNSDLTRRLSLAQLQAESHQCYCCRYMLECIRKTSERWHSLGVRPNSHLQMGYHFRMYNQSTLTDALSITISLDGEVLGTEVFSLEEPPSLGIRALGNSTGSLEALEFAKECLDKCRLNHKECGSFSRNNPSTYPTRLVEVKGNGLRVVETADRNITGPYASLSHSWGGAEILALTSENIATLKTEILFSKLPKTFQDAVLVTRELGIDYIWIDSLCIIQDSKEDWHKEASMMLDVYQNALCNIAACDSLNSFTGLFRDRDPAILELPLVEVDNGSPKRGPFQLVAKGYYMTEVSDAPLNQRCWVVQERMISERIINFTSEQIIWDCAELTASESLPHGTDVWSGFAPERVSGCKKNSHFLTVGDTVENYLGQWAKIVNTYSACGLTFPGDKFTAISGMADNLRRKADIQYYAGIWQPKMEIQLAWQVKQTTNGPRNDLGPSWSWVSVNSAVDLQPVDMYEGYDVTILASVIDVDVRRHVHENRVEKFTGCLRMRCVLNPITANGTTENLRINCRGSKHLSHMRLDSPEFIGSKRLFWIPLFDVQYDLYASSNGEKRRVSSEVRGIVVQEVDGSAGVFTRCGHGFFSGRSVDDSLAFPEDFEYLKTPEGKSNILCKDYDDRSGHLITIV